MGPERRPQQQRDMGVLAALQGEPLDALPPQRRALHAITNSHNLLQ